MNGPLPFCDLSACIYNLKIWLYLLLLFFKLEKVSIKENSQLHTGFYLRKYYENGHGTIRQVKLTCGEVASD